MAAEHEQNELESSDQDSAQTLQAELADALPQYVSDPRLRRQRRERKAKQKKVSNARSALLVVVFLTGLMALLYLAAALMSQSTDHYVQLGAYFLLTLLYIGLYAWARKEPYRAILTGLCIFVGLCALDVVAAMLYDPSNVFRGVFGRIVIIFFLAHGYLAAKRLKTQAATRVE